MGLSPGLIPLGCGELWGTVGSGCVCSVFLASSSLVPTLGRGSAPHRDVAQVPVPRSWSTSGSQEKFRLHFAPKSLICCHSSTTAYSCLLFRVVVCPSRKSFYTSLSSAAGQAVPQLSLP